MKPGMFILTFPLILALVLTPAMVRLRYPQRHIIPLFQSRIFLLPQRHALLGQPHSGLPAQSHLVWRAERCTFFQAQRRWWVFRQTQRYIDLPRSSWIPRSGFSSVKQNETFLSRAVQTTYGRVLDKPMTFDVGVYRWGFNGTCHDCIVVSNTFYGCVTLELCRDPEMRSRRIIPMCQQFHGSVKYVIWKKERVKCTFKELAEVAMTVWCQMGSYDCIENNCQDFCNHFLECIEAPPYMTTVESARLAAIAIGLSYFMIRKK